MRWTLTLLVLLAFPPGKLHADSNKVLVVLGLPEKLMAEALLSAQDQWGASSHVSITTVGELRAKNSAIFNNVDVIVSAGVNGCQYAVANSRQGSVFCTLLSQNSFENIHRQYPLAKSSALVLDQPLSRQVAVSSAVFPALQKFSILRSVDDTAELIPDATKEFLFDSRRGALAPAVTRAVENTDALVALPDQAVFNRNTIRTIMLTAYGHGKPIIGYSEAFVRAGALLTTYSTVGQSFRQVAEILDRYQGSGEPSFDRIYPPRYFSIAVNSTIAKSLQLVQAQDITLDRSWLDEDFPL